MTAIRILLRVSCRSYVRICAIALSQKFCQDSDVSDILFVSIRSIDSHLVDSNIFVSSPHGMTIPLDFPMLKVASGQLMAHPTISRSKRRSFHGIIDPADLRGSNFLPEQDLAFTCALELRDVQLWILALLINKLKKKKCRVKTWFLSMFHKPIR